MGMFLNSKSPYADYREMVSDLYFVDKSILIQELLPALGKKNLEKGYTIRVLLSVH